MNLVVFLNIIIHAAFVGSRVAMALLAIELGANTLDIGVMVALYSVPPFLLALYAGRVTDRYGAWPPMLFGAMLIGAGLFLPFAWRHLAALYCSATIIGTAFVFYNVATQNLTGAWGPREMRAKNFSTLSLGYSISNFVGPLAAGYAIDYLGYTATYLCFSLSSLVPVGVILLNRTLKQVELPAAATDGESGFALLRLPELRKVLIAGAMVVTGWDLYMFYMPIYGHSIGMPASRIGIVLGVFATATFVVRFSLPWLTQRYTGPRVLAIAISCGAATFVLLPFVTGIWPLAALSFAIGLALGCGQPLTLLLCYNRSPVGHTGEATGIRLTLNHLTHTIVPVAAGGLGAAFGMAPVFIMIAAILAVSGYLSSTVRPSRAGPPPTP